MGVGREEGERKREEAVEQKVIVGGMDGHTSKPAEKAKVMWECRGTRAGWYIRDI